MAFGGFFGGGSSSNNNNDKDTTSTAEDIPTTTFYSSPPPSSSPLTSSSSASSPELKSRIQAAITQQSNIANAKALMSKINENCFDHCISAPGTSLSAKENGCISACMEKYIEGWNVVSRGYVGRLQREQAAGGGF